jgi:putative aminopeptidase FrvX
MDVGQDYIGSSFMDDRASIVACCRSQGRCAKVASGGEATYLVFTTNEEIGGIGGSYASRTLPGDLTLTLGVGPTEPEYDTTGAGGPIVADGDAPYVYDEDVADRLMEDRPPAELAATGCGARRIRVQFVACQG